MKKILIVVDYQNDFVDGSLAFDEAPLLEGAITNKIEQYLHNGDTVAFTFDTHDADYLQTQEGANLPVEHCIRNTKGWALYGKVAAYCTEDTPRFYKETFGSLELANYLKEQQFDVVELAGLVSNICVLSNAVLAKAALPEADIIVERALTDSFDKDLHEKTFDILKGIQINVL
jgi:nicotinamidase-related amidase